MRNALMKVIYCLRRMRIHRGENDEPVFALLDFALMNSRKYIVTCYHAGGSVTTENFLKHNFH